MTLRLLSNINNQRSKVSWSKNLSQGWAFSRMVQHLLTLNIQETLSLVTDKTGAA